MEMTKQESIDDANAFHQSGGWLGEPFVQEEHDCNDYEKEFVDIEYYDYKVFRRYKCLGCGEINAVEVRD